MYEAKRLGKPRYRGLDSVKMWEGACPRWRCTSLTILVWPTASGASPLPHLDLIGCQGLHTPFVRADAAMYKAKRLGKHRVIAG
ncbi:hypothetical protein QFZ45_001564 [Pseudomonas synxantha]|nr:hypothetical protein [Pseudomonas synxantha]MDQ0978386.1 hypothetical protein [Pseudomonas synxantha]